MRFTLILFFCLLLSLSNALEANAASVLAQGDNSQQDEASVSLSNENIDELISTLEDEQAREEFLQNLKTLKSASDQQEDKKDATPLSDAIGLNAIGQNIINSYETFLEQNNLNAGLFGKSVLSSFAILAALVLSFINRRVCIALRNYLATLRDKYRLSHDRFRFYARMLRYLGYFLITVLFMFTMIKIWGGDIFLLSTEQTRALTTYSLNILIIILCGVIIWELANALLEYSMRNLSIGRANRVQTVLPILRNILFIAFMTLFALVLLSELGINIVPLLAGAGIFGIAVGFGAQTMVKDFLTGFVIILEDLIQVGDVANVGDRIGLVEKITMRKVQLRDLSGIVYTVPFSDISIVENWTKDFSYYLMDVGVAYREDTDQVIEHLREIDKDLREDENYKDSILEPIEILGVDAFADSAVIIKARIKTLPIKQWEVGREFNRRMKYKFDNENIEIPFPHQTIYFGEDKQGNAPAAPIILKEQRAKKEKTESQKKKKTPSKKSNTKETDTKVDNSDSGE